MLAQLISATLNKRKAEGKQTDMRYFLKMSLFRIKQLFRRK